MRRPLWNIAGSAALLLGTIGILVPILPTVPFYILAAFCFGKGNPAWEARLLAHPRWGPPIHDWRERGAISRRAKFVSITMLAASALGGLLLVRMPWGAVPAVIAVICGAWLWTRPDA